MKYRYVNIILMSVFTLVLSSCDDFLTLYPEDDIVDDEYWETGEQVQSVVASCYRFMLEDGVMSRMIYWGEVRSDNMDYAASASVDEKYLKDANLLSSNSLVTWDGFYKVINICNKVIQDAPAVRGRDANFTEEKLRNYLAEAYTIRALCYFYLVRTFGDVPYETKPSESEERDYQLAQSSAEELIIPSIIEDLILSEDYAAIEWATNRHTRGRITKNAVRALLADVYLWKASYENNTEQQDDYQACIEACNRVLADDSELLKMIGADQMYRTVFASMNSTESIFEFNFDVDGKKNEATPNLYGNPNKGKTARFEPTASLFTDYVAGSVKYDYRARDFLAATLEGTSDGNVSTPTSFKAFKYEGQSPASSLTNHSSFEYIYRSSSSTSNWILYRLSDIYLMKAEAKAELATTNEQMEEVVSLCNVTYKRATMEMDSLRYEDYVSVDDVKALVLLERRREFCFEGKRWFDLFRKARREGTTQNAYLLLEKAYAREVSIYKARLSNMEAWYIPISRTEMNSNSNLKQNSYYATKEQ